MTDAELYSMHYSSHCHQVCICIRTVIKYASRHCHQVCMHTLSPNMHLYSHCHQVCICITLHTVAKYASVFTLSPKRILEAAANVRSVGRCQNDATETNLPLLRAWTRCHRQFRACECLAAGVLDIWHVDDHTHTHTHTHTPHTHHTHTYTYTHTVYIWFWPTLDACSISPDTKRTPPAGLELSHAPSTVVGCATAKIHPLMQTHTIRLPRVRGLKQLVLCLWMQALHSEYPPSQHFKEHSVKNTQASPGAGTEAAGPLSLDTSLTFWTPILNAVHTHTHTHTHTHAHTYTHILKNNSCDAGNEY